MIVDRRLPDGDGLDIIRLQKQTKATITIVITAKGQLDERVAGLDANADYYLVKPVATSELLALLRRLNRRMNSDQMSGWKIDPRTWNLQTPKGQHSKLTRREFSVMSCFIGRPGQTASKEEVIRALGEDPLQYDTRRLEVLIRRLRKKIEDVASEEFPLITVYGIGYSFNALLTIA